MEFDYLLKDIADLTPVAEEFCKRFKPHQLKELDNRLRTQFDFEYLDYLINRVEPISLEKAGVLTELKTNWESDIWEFYLNGIDQTLQKLGFSKGRFNYWLLKTDYGFGAIHFDNAGHPGYLKLSLGRHYRPDCLLASVFEEIKNEKHPAPSVGSWSAPLSSFFEESVSSHLLPIWDDWNHREARLKEISEAIEKTGLLILSLCQKHFREFFSEFKHLQSQSKPVRLILSDSRFKEKWKCFAENQECSQAN